VSVNQRWSKVGVAILMGAITMATVQAGELGHFGSGAYSIRDFAVPDPGFYAGIYNYSYSTTRVNDASGNAISSRTLTGPGGASATLNLKVDVSVFAQSPFVMWVAKKKVLGAKFAMQIAPSYSNGSVSGLLSFESRTGQSLSTGQFNIGDTFVQPLWLGWTGKHYDIGYSYGFYAPTGKFQAKTVTYPVIGPVYTESANNTGYGFWTNQNQGSAYFYPWADQRLAIENVLTWEVHRKKRNVDITAGQNLTWSWGVSEYLPLTKDQNLLLEAGPAGYSSFQVTDDRGSAAVNPHVHDSVHAAGLQIGITSVKKNMTLNYSWFHEFRAVDRFQGTSMGLNYALKF
jgi:hypothetical protein